MKRYVQGDVILKKVSKLPSNMETFNTKTKVLQESEVTGHHHHFKPTALVDLYIPTEVERSTDNLDKLFTTITPDLGKYIVVKEDALLFHGKGFDVAPAENGTGDHKALSIPAGIYKIDIAREYDYEYMEESRVVD